MKNRVLLYLGLCLAQASFVDAFFYMNSQPISFKSVITGSCCTEVDYNIVNAGDGTIGGHIRLFGIHNMHIDIPGYERVYLVEDDVCFHCHLFTMLWFFGNNNAIVQRWACVKWFLPLSFGFALQEDDSLTIFSSIWKYRILAPFRAIKNIALVKKQNDLSVVSSPNKNKLITVSINGRTVSIDQKTVLQIYSTSSLKAAGIVPYPFWPML